ncbi:MAG TPA: sensor histidine kinase [Betaproteobacteria bacterium]|nr:sensor histidine kinase [Betaproteobacteria bacterium]
MHDSVLRSVLYSKPKMPALGAVGVVGFPLYYFVWHYLIPQPYENLSLRLFGCALFLPLIFINYWPPRLRRLLPVYWYFSVFYALPFFFTFMLFKNDGSAVWQMATLVAIFLMALLMDWLNVVIMLLLGTTLAWFAYVFTTPIIHLPHIYLADISIYLFAIVSITLLNFSAEIVKQEKLRAMLATASNIAHELRTPLLGMKSGAAGLRRYLPALLEAYQLARAQGLPVTPVRKAHLDAMAGVLERIEAEAVYSNTVIDMLLINARPTGRCPDGFANYSMARCVDAALARYPFAPAVQRRLVHWDADGDFRFHGSDLLMTHVLFNLLKNALYYIAKAGVGNIQIRLEPGATANQLVFRDTGAGIPAHVLPHIFTRFYSWSPGAAPGPGVGIGLAFCRTVVDSFGGAIACHSRWGEYTEFVITFPLPPPDDNDA